MRPGLAAAEMNMMLADQNMKSRAGITADDAIREA